MELNKIFKSILLILFLIFLVLYFSANLGVIDYEAKHKTIMTEEAIKEFESDIENGNEVNIKKYLKNKNMKYDNMLSKNTLRVSNNIGKCVEGVLKLFFSKMEKALSSN